jgi:hypothetical protein
MYAKWAVGHDHAFSMRRVAQPLLINAILTMDYGDIVSRNDLIARLRESASSYESTMIPLGHHNNFEFAVNPAAHMPNDIGSNLLRPLPSFVERAIFQGHSSVSQAYFRITGRTIRELWCRAPEDKRESRYGCWSGDSLYLNLLARAGMSPVGYQADALAPDVVDLSKPSHGISAVAKRRTMSLSSNMEVTRMAAGASREVSGSSTASRGTASATASTGKALMASPSSSPHTVQSSVSSPREYTSPVGTSGVARFTLPRETTMLAAISGAASTLDNGVFLYIGALRARPASHGTAQPCDSGQERGSTAAPGSRASGPIHPWAKTDYIVAVNLCDLSVVLVYIAWHDDPEM